MIHLANPPMTRRSAFTLIELLIVVAIIAILAAIAVPNFLEAQVRAKVSRANNDMRALATALEVYHVDHNTYPP
jgi:type II secretion system protein G